MGKHVTREHEDGRPAVSTSFRLHMLKRESCSSDPPWPVVQITVLTITSSRRH